MDPVAMNTTVYFIWKVAYCCHMDSNCIGITNGLSYIGLHYSCLLYTSCSPQERTDILYQWKDDERLLNRNKFIGDLYNDFQTHRDGKMCIRDRDNIQDVETAIRLSKAVIRNIKQNLFWAFFYNTLGIPIAAGVLHLFGGPLLDVYKRQASRALEKLRKPASNICPLACPLNRFINTF